MTALSLPHPLDLIFTAFLGALGLCVGSFLNVVIARVPEGLSIVRPASRCPNCGHQLSALENIPLVSWLALGGRCRGCRAPISWRYPAVELLTGLLFLACLRRFGWTWELVAALVLVSLLVALTFIDLAHWILPFAITLPGIAAGLLLALPLGMERLVSCAVGAAAGFVAFWLLEWVGERIFRKEALGGGDKYLLAMIGAFLGWRPLLAIVFLSSLQGAVVGSLLLLTRGRAGPAPQEQEAAPEPGAGPHAQGAAGAAPVQAAPVQATPVDATAHEAPAPGPVREASDEEDDWEPGPTNIPFGPWLALAALEVLLFGPVLHRLLPGALGLFLGEGP